ncbi:MAG: hypothetical protein K7J46_22030 [Bryobacter sp.]|jgi:hypothetical protein|nr:hypothetical protein [Bryobacter sp. CoA8 C33]
MPLLLAFLLSLSLFSCGPRNFRVVAEYEAPSGGYRFLAKSGGVIPAGHDSASELDASLEVEIILPNQGEIIIARERGQDSTNYVARRNLAVLTRDDHLDKVLRTVLSQISLTLPEEELRESLRAMDAVSGGPKSVLCDGQTKYLRVLWVQIQ